MKSDEPFHGCARRVIVVCYYRTSGERKEKTVGEIGFL